MKMTKTQFRRCNATGHSDGGSVYSEATHNLCSLLCVAHGFCGYFGQGVFMKSSGSGKNQANMTAVLGCAPKGEGPRASYRFEYGNVVYKQNNATLCTVYECGGPEAYTSQGSVEYGMNTITMCDEGLLFGVGTRGALKVDQAVERCNFVNNSLPEEATSYYKGCFAYLGGCHATFEDSVIAFNRFKVISYLGGSSSEDWSGAYFCMNDFDGGLTGKGCTKTLELQAFYCEKMSKAFSMESLSLRFETIIIFWIME